jgi:hypothetical protein
MIPISVASSLCTDEDEGKLGSEQSLFL